MIDGEKQAAGSRGRIVVSKLDFGARIAQVDPAAQRADRIDTLVVNVGRRCEIACGHCHHRCSPEATEQMSHEVMEQVLGLGRALGVGILDITGGSPDLWPHLPELLERAADAKITPRIRTNLVRLAGESPAGFARLLARTGTIVMASLPEDGIEGGSALRPGGDGARIRALRVLVDLGYGGEGGPALEFAVNPEVGLPDPEDVIASRMASGLAQLGIRRFRVRSIANAPLGRFADHLSAGGRRRSYLHGLADAFDRAAVPTLPCRNGLAVAWDGRLYDCDFNVSAGLALTDAPATVAEALDAPDRLIGRFIRFGPHCFSCTIGAGSG